VRVRITDADGRSVERVADDGEGAATAIESWTRQDVADPLLAVREVARAEATTTTSPQLEERVGRPSAPAWELAALGVAAMSEDSAFWSGARVVASARVGWLSLGGRLGVSFDTGMTGDTRLACTKYGPGEFDYRDRPGCETSRTLLDLLVSADVPFVLGSLRLSPGLGFGQRTAWANRADEDVGDTDERKDDANGLLLEAHLGVMVAVARDWSLRLDLSGAIVPGAQTRLGATDEFGDPEYVPPLAGVPLVQGMLGVGLAWAPEGDRS
jgi:hypothetical protein